MNLPLKAVPKTSIYEEIRRRIVCMEYKPGSSLDEKSLVDELGTSRTPVREALIRLSGEGLVEIEKNKGAKVTELDLVTLQSIFEAGDLIERAYTRLACLRRSEADLAKIEAAMHRFESDLKRQDVAAMTQSNSDFHLLIAAASGNKYFVDSYRRILADHERIAQLWYGNNFISGDDAVNRLLCEQHSILFKALQEQDAETAERVSVEHASLCKEGIRQLLSSGEALMADIQIKPVSLSDNKETP
ncbi:MAG: GntR family transcriptional regulator [Pseudomonadota bacterium]